MTRFYLVVAALVAACGAGAPPPQAFTLTVPARGVDLDSDGRGALAVNVVPANPDEPVELAIAGAPGGLSGGSLTLPPSARSGAFALRAVPGTRFDAEVTVTATNGGLAQRVSIWVSAGLTSGLIDPSFGDGGVAAVGAGASDRICQWMGVAPDGKIALVVTEAEHAMALVRLGADGRPDTVLGPGGRLSLPSYPHQVSGFAIMEDGALLVAGSDDAIQLWRLRRDGSLDPSFGTGGAAEIAAPGWYRRVGVRDGKIVAASGAQAVRFTPDGKRDSTYGTDGVLALSLPDDFAYADDPILLDDGGWLFVGHSGAAAAVVRVGADGAIVAASRSPQVGGAYVGALPDGAGGFYLLARDARGETRVARIGEGLVLDQAFGAGGQAEPFPGDLDVWELLAVDKGGKVIARGSWGGSRSGEETVLLRYGRDGRLDPTFRLEGKAYLRNVARGELGTAQCPAAVDADGALLYHGSRGGVVRIRL